MKDSPKVLFEDEHLFVVFKPAGMLVVPSEWTPADDTLLGWAKRRVGARVWALHRLDRETSGAVIFAKTPEACRSMHHQFEARTVEKVYDALVKGSVSKEQGLITLRVGQGRRWTKTKVGLGGESARTEYKVRERCGPVTWLEVHPRTGRFHQIRAHLAAIGHPLAYDPLYHRDSPWPWLKRVPLHCSRLSFSHPATGESIAVSCPLPEDLQKALRRFHSMR